MKSAFVSSDCWRLVSFDPTWTIILLIVVGSDAISPGSLAMMSGVVAPGKQCVTALMKRMFLMMESPIIRVVGGISGRRGVPGLGDLGERRVVAPVCGMEEAVGCRSEVVSSSEGHGFTAVAKPVITPELRLITASVNNLRQADVEDLTTGLSGGASRGGTSSVLTMSDLLDSWRSRGG